ncbi:hypothetical protein FOA43_003335 [Brettanomyces nanus]|uniref:BBC1/AIM3 cysteine proteinase-fold domain-containing protein n=1 Tax=Eeniella nana TaxID=13502 RepID=A0A875S8D6_EENNA|nr:uncharacterized protein FOA43_003335 [Brettanomyces nanus]QPG75949.1 hypothetical protein FOA43_003335 [Brettanomyces nanus]
MSSTRKQTPPTVPAKKPGLRAAVSINKVVPIESLREKLVHVRIESNAHPKAETETELKTEIKAKPRLPVKENSTVESSVDTALAVAPSIKKKPRSLASKPPIKPKPQYLSKLNAPVEFEDAPIKVKAPSVSSIFLKGMSTPPITPTSRKLASPKIGVPEVPSLPRRHQQRPQVTLQEDEEQEITPPLPTRPADRVKGLGTLTSPASSSASLTSRSRSSSTISTPPLPPPPRSRIRTTVSTPPPLPPLHHHSRESNHWKEPDLDLEIPTCWFALNDSSKLPKCFQGCNWVASHGTLGKIQYSIYAFRLSDLATVRLKFSWDGSYLSPLDTLKQEVSFLPPPTASKQQLLDGSKIFGEHIANWCEVREGEKVGNGECWTLARDALQKACGNHAFVSSGLNHGALLVTYKMSPTTGKLVVIQEPITDDIKRGDILQFKSSFFKCPDKSITFGAPDHTALVLNVGGSKLQIIQQNNNGKKVVAEDQINLDNMAGGELKVFRPVSANWIVDLSDAAMK